MTHVQYSLASLNYAQSAVTVSCPSRRCLAFLELLTAAKFCASADFAQQLHGSAAPVIKSALVQSSWECFNCHICMSEVSQQILECKERDEVGKYQPQRDATMLVIEHRDNTGLTISASSHTTELPCLPHHTTWIDPWCENRSEAVSYQHFWRHHFTSSMFWAACLLLDNVKEKSAGSCTPSCTRNAKATKMTSSRLSSFRFFFSASSQTFDE